MLRIALTAPTLCFAEQNGLSEIEVSAALLPSPSVIAVGLASSPCPPLSQLPSTMSRSPVKPCAAAREAMAPWRAASPRISQRDGSGGPGRPGPGVASAIPIASAFAVAFASSPATRAPTAAAPNGAAKQVGHTPRYSTFGPSIVRPSRVIAS
jgi:hypothetical protein